MPSGVACMPSTDRADDEDLACSQADYSQEPSDMHLPENLLWDEPIKDVLSPMIPSNSLVSRFLEFRSDGEDNFLLDLEFHQDILEDCNDRDLPTLETHDQFSFSGTSFQPGLEIDIQATAVAAIQERDCATSLVLDLDGPDDETNFDSSQEISQSENIDFDGFASGTVFRLLDGHVVQDTSSSDQNSQDNIPYDMEDESQTRSLFPSMSGALLDQKAGSMEKIRLNEYWPYNPAIYEGDMSILLREGTNELILQERVDKEDLELDFLTDSAGSDSDRMDTTLLVDKLFENDGVARPALSGRFFSHQPITWPLQAEHERSPDLDDFENGDEDSLWDVESGGDESESCIGDNEHFLTMYPNHLIFEALE
ncbi:hypothetical protein C0992_009393 [Termitomyces sp. T32_za158]|nr:hypothetical protein C0992_009393 [Termitomyces sp. T32_za158]